MISKIICHNGGNMPHDLLQPNYDTALEKKSRAETLLSECSLQEKVLLKVLVNYIDQNNVSEAARQIVAFEIKNGARVHSLSSVTTESIEKVLNLFEKDPKDVTAILRWALIALYRDTKISLDFLKTDRLERYLQASLTLQVRMDRAIFKADDAVKAGVPEYIPDGLSDMGSDPEIDPLKREREKIRVDKAKIFSRYSGRLLQLFMAISESNEDPNSTNLKGFMVEFVSQAVYEELPYDRFQLAGLKGVLLGQSININYVAEHRLAVCRHQALETQVLLQALGINCQLLKCKVEFFPGRRGAHVANLVRLNGTWYLLDVTNPDFQANTPKVFLREIKGLDKNPYLDDKDHVWELGSDIGLRKYILRRNMFYRIRDNKLDSLD